MTNAGAVLDRDQGFNWEAATKEFGFYNPGQVAEPQEALTTQSGLLVRNPQATSVAKFTHDALGPSARVSTKPSPNQAGTPFDMSTPAGVRQAYAAQAAADEQLAYTGTRYQPFDGRGETLFDVRAEDHIQVVEVPDPEVRRPFERTRQFIGALASRFLKDTFVLGGPVSAASIVGRHRRK